MNIKLFLARAIVTLAIGSLAVPTIYMVIISLEFRMAVFVAVVITCILMGVVWAVRYLQYGDQA